MVWCGSYDYEIINTIFRMKQRCEELKAALMNNIQKLLLELGKGFACHLHCFSNML